MNKAKFSFTFIVIFFLLSCGQRNDENTATPVRQDTVKIAADNKEQELMERRKEAAEQERIDSINNEKILSEAIAIAGQYAGREKFKNNYDRAIADSSYQVEIDISSDFYFSGEFPHLIIRRKTPVYSYIDIFSKTNNRFQKILSHEQWSLEYIGDTIRDVNGDGFRDFVVNWYGNTGCCLKAFSDVYLLRPGKNSFSGNFKFINPTFSPKEQMIRGVCYGHPGDTEMYKYKWNGEAVDTIEYVYYEKNDKREKTGKIIVSNKRFGDDNDIIKRLNYIPAEYKKIMGYDWFTDNLGERSKR